MCEQVIYKIVNWLFN